MIYTSIVILSILKGRLFMKNVYHYLCFILASTSISAQLVADKLHDPLNNAMHIAQALPEHSPEKLDLLETIDEVRLLTYLIPNNVTINGNLTTTGEITGTISPATSYTATAGAAISAHYANTAGSVDVATAATYLQIDGGGNAGTHNGFSNTAIGYQALASTTAGNNTAYGWAAMANDSSGDNNTAVGVSALQQNTTGYNNVALGYSALSSVNESYNTALGIYALGNSSSGNHNIAIGAFAGSLSNTDESNNIYIGHQGVRKENNTIRLGTTGTNTSCYIAGDTTIIGGLSTTLAATFNTGLNVTNGPVYLPTSALSVIPSNPFLLSIGSDGRLGVAPSSQRYKENITDLENQSAALMQLRPVTFTYTSDQSRQPQVGLIAEEVEKILPILVIYNKDNTPESVAYQSLASLLLSEIQQQHKHIQEQDGRLKMLEQTVAALRPDNLVSA